MHSVSYITQKAIEIANNSSHEIIIGVMNQKDVEADCSAVSPDINVFSKLQHAVSARRQARDELRSERTERRNTFKAEIKLRQQALNKL